MPGSKCIMIWNPFHIPHCWWETSTQFILFHLNYILTPSEDFAPLQLFVSTPYVHLVYFLFWSNISKSTRDVPVFDLCLNHCLKETFPVVPMPLVCPGLCIQIVDSHLKWRPSPPLTGKLNCSRCLKHKTKQTIFLQSYVWDIWTN